MLCKHLHDEQNCLNVKMRGAKSWFPVESKSFKISLEEVGGKLSGRIVERSKGFSSWIRFREFSLCNLLDGVEACCRDEVGKRCSKVWVENGREFRLKCRSNKAGRFIHCMVKTMETKRFSLCFPEGRSLPRGWSVLAEKLHHLGVDALSVVGVAPPFFKFVEDGVA